MAEKTHSRPQWLSVATWEQPRGPGKRGNIPAYDEASRTAKQRRYVPFVDYRKGGSSLNHTEKRTWQKWQQQEWEWNWTKGAHACFYWVHLPQKSQNDRVYNRKKVEERQHMHFISFQRQLVDGYGEGIHISSFILKKWIKEKDEDFPC